MLSAYGTLSEGPANCPVQRTGGGSRVRQTHEEARQWMLWRCTCR